MVHIDWISIRNEYISTNTSYRKLAKKYGVSQQSVSLHGKEENWVELKEKRLSEISTKIEQKTTDKIVDEAVDKISRINQTVDRLLDKIEEATEQLNKHLVKNKKKTKVIEYNNHDRPDKPTKETIDEYEEAEFVEGDVDRMGLKMVVGALKDLAELSKIDVTGDDSEEKQTALISVIEKAMNNED